MTPEDLIRSYNNGTSENLAFRTPQGQKMFSQLKSGLNINLVVASQSSLNRVDNGSDGKAETHAFYDPDTRTIVVSDKTGFGTAFRQFLMHELTHSVESTKRYSANGGLADQLIKYAYGGTGTRQYEGTVYALQQAGYGANEIQSELAAKAMEKVVEAFSDENRDESFINELMSDSAGKRLVARVYNSIAAFTQKMRAKLTGNQELLDRLNTLDEVRKNMRAALKEAAEQQRAQGNLDSARNSVHPGASQFSRSQLADAVGLIPVYNEAGDQFAMMNEKGEIVREITPEMIKKTPMGKVIDAALVASNERRAKGLSGAITEESAEQAREFFAKLATMCAQGQDATLVWEVASTELFSALKSNSDKQYSTTVDFGTICAKTQAIIDVMSYAMKKLGRGLTRQEVTDIYKATAKVGYSVPCPVCYVFSRWMGVPSLLGVMSEAQDRFVNVEYNSDGSVKSWAIDEKQVYDYIK